MRPSRAFWLALRGRRKTALLSAPTQGIRVLVLGTASGPQPDPRAITVEDLGAGAEERFRSSWISSRARTRCGAMVPVSTVSLRRSDQQPTRGGRDDEDSQGQHPGTTRRSRAVAALARHRRAGDRSAVRDHVGARGARRRARRRPDGDRRARAVRQDQGIGAPAGGGQHRRREHGTRDRRDLCGPAVALRVLVGRTAGAPRRHVGPERDRRDLAFARLVPTGPSPRRRSRRLFAAGAILVMLLPLGPTPRAQEASPTPSPPPVGVGECLTCHGVPDIVAAAGTYPPAPLFP